MLSLYIANKISLISNYVKINYEEIASYKVKITIVYEKKNLRFLLVTYIKNYLRTVSNKTVKKRH